MQLIAIAMEERTSGEERTERGRQLRVEVLRELVIGKAVVDGEGGVVVGRGGGGGGEGGGRHGYWC